MRIILILSFCLFAGLQSASADLWWGNGGALSNSVGTALAAHDTDPTIGVFAQLIRIVGGGNTASSFVNVGTGVSGNDVVWDTAFAGQGDDLFVNGIFPLTPGVFGSQNDYYYVRVYDAAQSALGDWNLSTNAPIPAAAQHYYESPTFQYTHNPLAPTDFNFAPEGGQTLILVPEPNVLALICLGVAGLFYHRRRLHA